MLDTPTLRVRVLRPDGLMYTDEYIDADADHFQMDPDRFREALGVKRTTRFAASASFRCSLPDVAAQVRVLRQRRERRDLITLWRVDRCVVSADVEELQDVLTDDCRSWHEEKGLDVPGAVVVRRLLAEVAVGHRIAHIWEGKRTEAGRRFYRRRRVVLGVALKGG